MRLWSCEQAKSTESARRLQLRFIGRPRGIFGWKYSRIVGDNICCIGALPAVFFGPTSKVDIAENWPLIDKGRDLNGVAMVAYYVAFLVRYMWLLLLLVVVTIVLDVCGYSGHCVVSVLIYCALLVRRRIRSRRRMAGTCPHVVQQYLFFDGVRRGSTRVESRTIAILDESNAPSYRRGEDCSMSSMLDIAHFISVRRGWCMMNICIKVGEAPPLRAQRTGMCMRLAVGLPLAGAVVSQWQRAIRGRRNELRADIGVAIPVDSRVSGARVGRPSRGTRPP